MESLLVLMWKPDYQNTLWALRFNCDLHKTEPPFAWWLHLLPSSFHRVWGGGWLLSDGHLPWSPTEVASSPPMVSSPSWGVPLCPSEPRSSIPLAQQLSEVTGYHRQTAKLLWLLIPGGHPGSFGLILAPGHSGLDSCPLLSHPAVPLPSACFSDSIAGKLGKSLKKLEPKCDVLAVKESLQNIYRLFKQLASTLGTNLSTGCLPALLGGRKI